MSNTPSEWETAKIHHLPNAAPQAAVEDEIDLGELLNFFWHRKLLLLLCIILSMILGALYVRQLPNLYQAEATLILEAQSQNFSGLEALAPGLSTEDAEMNSQVEVLKSRQVIGAVVDKLALFEDPEFVASLREPSFIRQSITWVKSQIGLTTEPRQINLRDSAIDQLTKNLSAAVIPKTHVFRIRLETEDFDKSVLIVNTLADAFVNDQIIAKKSSTDSAAEWLTEKVANLEVSLNEAEAKAAAFRSETERSVTEQVLQQSNLRLKNARGRYDSFILSLEQATGSKVPASDRDVTQLNLILKNITELEAIVKKQTNDLLVIRQLDREAIAEGEIYKHFAARLNEIEVQKGLHESDVRILSAAVPRPIATKPRKLMTVLGFGILGLVLSAVYILIRKFMDRSFSNAENLQGTFGIPVIASIPSAPVRNRRKLLNYALKRPSSGIMESIRGLRTSVLDPSRSSAEDSMPLGKTLLFTSSIPGEGKTTSSVLLAINAAALEKKVLLVECDLRRSTFRTYFGPRTQLGLLDVIQQNEGWEGAIWSEPGTGADIIFGGQSKGRNAGDIFASREFTDFIERMKSRYDLVILDSPPVLPVPDARLIANHCDQIIYAVKSSSTPSSVVSAGLRLFDTTNTRVDGLVLTQIQKNAGYGIYGYGYGSEYYQN